MFDARYDSFEKCEAVREGLSSRASRKLPEHLEYDRRRWAAMSWWGRALWQSVAWFWVGWNPEERQRCDIIFSAAVWEEARCGVAPANPVEVPEAHRDDAQVGTHATAALGRRRPGGKWHIMQPPQTWAWWRPFTSIPDDAAPIDRWTPTSLAFDTREACEVTRTELVRREASPHRRLRRWCWDCQAPDFYSHTRCAFVQP